MSVSRIVIVVCVCMCISYVYSITLLVKNFYTVICNSKILTKILYNISSKNASTFFKKFPIISLYVFVQVNGKIYFIFLRDIICVGIGTYIIVYNFVFRLFIMTL